VTGMIGGDQMAVVVPSPEVIDLDWRSLVLGPQLFVQVLAIGTVP